jgi:hypothetical protein
MVKVVVAAPSLSQAVEVVAAPSLSHQAVEVAVCAR